MTRETSFRIVADALLINASILTALVVRFIFLVAFERARTSQDHNVIFWQYLQGYLNNFWLLTLVCLAVFAMSGFYTYGRFYRGRYKVLIVAQAVSVGYLLFGFLSYFFGIDNTFPRGALLLSWVISLVVLTVARVWSIVWRSVCRYESNRVDAPDRRKTRNVLVIGGAGYIGSALLKKLLDRGYRVRLLDMLLYGTDAIKDILDHPRLEILQADFRHIDKVVDAMRGMDACIHLGAIVGDPACALDEELTIEVNLMATRMIAEVAKGSGVSRFIFASTCSVYGASDELLDERSALNPVSLYARSKIASEQVLMEMADSSFVPTILRFGTIYGLSGRTRFDLVINLLTAKAMIDEKITVMGSDQWRPFVHVDDAALAVFKVLEAPLVVVRNQVFNVGSDEQNFTIGQIGEMIKRLVPAAELLDLGPDGDRRNYRVDFARIRTALGFKPRWQVEDGIRQVIEAIQSGQVDDYRDARYSNVKFLSDEGSYRLMRQNGWAHELIYKALPEFAAMIEQDAAHADNLLLFPARNRNRGWSLKWKLKTARSKSS